METLAIHFCYVDDLVEELPVNQGTPNPVGEGRPSANDDALHIRHHVSLYRLAGFRDHGDVGRGDGRTETLRGVRVDHGGELGVPKTKGVGAVGKVSEEYSFALDHPTWELQ